MKIAITSTKEPKIQGIQDMINNCPYFKDNLDNIEYVAHGVDSGVSDMPMTMQEIMDGAKGRVDNLRKKVTDADYYFGIEGGVQQIVGKGYLGGVVYAENNAGKGHYGFSQFLEVPEEIMKKLLNGGDLGPIMSELSGIVNISNKQGSMGAWTDGMFTRKGEFEEASKAAIAPFYNEFYKVKL
ncbi:MAG: inosine/xanthosine triphosphatase [Candidatus Gracilibacteria bacterium]|nr:inosine/xanthosine triphosphatase [Candidatus Gracilibacteria bacterium]